MERVSTFRTAPYIRKPGNECADPLRVLQGMPDVVFVGRLFAVGLGQWFDLMVLTQVT